MNRTLRITLIASVIFHLGLAAYFLIRGKHAGPLKHGSIAVDFIHSVPHGSVVDPHNHPGRKAKAPEPSSTNKPSTAQANEATQQPANAPGDPNSGARESDAYIFAVTQLINARKIYPRSAVEREEEGRVILGVTLDREGHVVASDLETPSPFDSLNAAALDTIKAVGKFPPLPAEVADPIHLHIPLIFKVDSR